VEQAALARDGFASEHLGVSVFRLTRPGDARDLLFGLADEPGPLMVEAKVSTEHPALVANLTKLGFWLIDTNVQLDVPAAALLNVPLPNGSRSWRIRDAKPDDRSALAHLVARNMVTSRYHLDPRIEPARATAFKQVWLSNFFQGRRGDGLLVADADTGVQGFLLVLEKGDQGVIDLIAVDPALRGTGVVRGLIRAWLQRAPQITRVVVGTQVSNVASLRAYGKLGFRICATSYLLHYWRDAISQPGRSQ